MCLSRSLPLPQLSSWMGRPGCFLSRGPWQNRGLGSLGLQKHLYQGSKEASLEGGVYSPLTATWTF